MYKYKSNFSPYKINEALGSIYNTGLENLYAADKIPNSSNFCSLQINDINFIKDIKQIYDWMNKVGYRN